MNPDPRKLKTWIGTSVQLTSKNLMSCRFMPFYTMVSCQETSQHIKAQDKRPPVRTWKPSHRLKGLCHYRIFLGARELLAKRWVSLQDYRLMARILNREMDPLHLAMEPQTYSHVSCHSLSLDFWASSKPIVNPEKRSVAYILVKTAMVRKIRSRGDYPIEWWQQMKIKSLWESLNKNPWPVAATSKK